MHATLEIVGPDNVDRCGIGCLVNRKNPGYAAKREWLRNRFDEGLRMLLFRDEAGKPLAFLEYVPGSFAWRPVEADGWLFIHCLWVYNAGRKVGGLGTQLIQACIDEARKADLRGVAVLASDGAWMIGKAIFLKNGFELIERADRFDLLTFRLRPGPAPRFRDPEDAAVPRRGLHLIYANQCPMLRKSADDLVDVARECGIALTVTELATARDAPYAPSYYGVFNLLLNGRVLADHYVSETRFKNLLRDVVQAS